MNMTSTRSYLLAALLVRALSAAAFADESQLSFALEGGTWTLKNSSCSAFVVSVDSAVYPVGPRSSVPLRKQSWKKWWWMPGTRGPAGERTVLSPLDEDAGITSGPGRGLHTGDARYGYDFGVKEGTPVYAMAAGTVIKTVDLYGGPHRDRRRLKENNRVLVQHADGTVAVYAHLKKGSLRVKECGQVEEGQLLAESGNSGYSDGPHLHVEVFRAVSGRRYRTLPLLFAPR